MLCIVFEPAGARARKARNTLYEKPIAGSGPVSRSRDSPQSLRDSSPHRGELTCMRVQSAEVKPCGSPASANLALWAFLAAAIISLMRLSWFASEAPGS